MKLLPDPDVRRPDRIVGAEAGPKIDPGTSQFLDLSRWGASLLVVLTHVRSLIFADYDHVTVSRSAAINALYFCTNFGHSAVVIFFVISGYLVGGRTVLSALAKGYSLGDYILHRLVRIYIVLGPALLAGFFLDFIGSRYFDDLGLYHHTGLFDISSLRFSPVDRLTTSIALENLLQLQTILVPPLGSNGPLWSLASEWWYYILAGIGLVTAFSPARSWRLISACIAILVLLTLPLGITLGLVLWLIGAAVGVFDQKWKAWPASVGIIVVIVTLSVIRLLPANTELVDPVGMASEFLSDFMTAVAFSLAILCSKRGGWRRGRLNPWLASFSYTTYLVHFPALLLLVSVFHRTFNYGVDEQPTATAVLFAAAVILILYGYSLIFAYLTERHTGKVRVLLSRVVETRLPGVLTRVRRAPKSSVG